MTRWRKHRFIAGCCAAAVLLLAAACGSSGTQPNKSAATGAATISIVQDIVSLANAPMYVAIQGGYYSREHIKIDLTTLQSGESGELVMESGKVDMAIEASFELGSLAAAGKPFTAIGNVLNGVLEVCGSKTFAQQHHLTSQSGVTAVFRSLNGATVGVSSPNSTPDLVGRYLITKYGNLNPNTQVKIVSLGSQTSFIPAIERGEIDAFVASPPTCAEAVATGKAVLLLEPSQIPVLTSTPQSVFYVSKKYAKANGPLLKRFMAAVAAAESYMRSNPSGTLAIMKKYFPNTTPSVLQAAVDNVILPAVPTTNSMNSAGWQNVSAMLKPITHVNLPVAADTIWTNQYVTS